MMQGDVGREIADADVLRREYSCSRCDVVLVVGDGSVADDDASDAQVERLVLGGILRGERIEHELDVHVALGILPVDEAMSSLIKGFEAMVPAILILTLAWTLKSMTDSLGAAEYVSGVVASSASELQMLLPGIIFLAGYCTAANGHELCFSIINNGIMHGSNARNFADKVCKLLCQP